MVNVVSQLKAGGTMRNVIARHGSTAAIGAALVMLVVRFADVALLHTPEYRWDYFSNITFSVCLALLVCTSFIPRRV